MNDLKAMIENESVEDILLFLAPKIPYPRIDQLFVRFRFEVVANGMLIRTADKLVKEEKLREDESGKIFKGRNWEAPQFVLDKKYGITRR